MKYPLTSDTWDEKERFAIERVLDSGRLTYGPETELYEKEIAQYFGSKYAVSFNSGSSANLAAAFALMHKSKGVAETPEVIVPMVSWSTTYFPFSQAGAKLVFVDIEKESLNIDPELVGDAINKNTVGVVAVNLLGNPSRLKELREMCSKNEIFLFEDNCESMGASINGKFTGTFGDIGSFSTFYSHHISTIEGGFSVTDSEELYQLMLSIRSHGWLRELPEENFLHNKTGDPFLDSYTFALPGFNIRPTEIASAAGRVQLKKLENFVRTRKENAILLAENLAQLPGIHMQREHHSSSWFGFSLLVPVDSNITKIREFLRNSGVEIRPVVSGNFLNQPVMQFLNHRVSSVTTNADDVSSRGFLVGNNQLNLSKEIDALGSALRIYFNSTDE